MAELTCVVRNKNGKMLSDEELRNTEIDVDLYYKIMATVIRRMDDETEFIDERKTQSL